MDYKEVKYFDTTIFWTDELDGCGNTMVDDFLDATNHISNNRQFKNTLEWCSGPGYWGFGLLASLQTEKLTLSDVELNNSYRWYSTTGDMMHHLLPTARSQQMLP